MLYQKKRKKLLPNDVLVWPTEKVGRMIFYKKFCKVDPLQFRVMYYSYFYEQKLLQVVSTEKNAIDFTGASMSLSAQTRMQRTFIWFNVKTLLYAWIVLVYL